MQGRGRKLRIAMVGLALLLVSLLAEGTSQARLHPYYVLKGVSFGQQKPRILFVLDTSGSMTWRAKKGSELCDWDECEGGSGTDQSKIHAARTAIRNVVLETQGVANFGLMTFDQRRPPTAKGHIPDECKYGKNDYRRFAFFTKYRDAYNWWRSADLYGYGGAWQLCGENRPYPYLRWDDLGRGSVIKSDDQNGAVPASPLISTKYADFSHSDNSKRKVQWFPEFLGVRVNLNAKTDPTEDLLDGTWGDYGVNKTGRKKNVWEQDFYYWPYVDGFPGYTFHQGAGVGQLGVVDEDNSLNAASLYAPFYLESAVKNFKQADIGPASIEEATAKVLALTDTLPNGGVDATGGTPWKSVVGPIIQAPAQTNGVFSHSTIASYLRFTRNIDDSDLCVPLAAVLVTDGDPSPSNEGGSGLHSRLSALRTKLGARVYVVGFLHGTNSLNNMACAAAGSDDDKSPCWGTPSKDWDTCFNPDDPKNECAFLANSAEELAKTLTEIVEGELALDVGSGPGSSVNDFGVGAGGNIGEGETVQTTVEGYTAWPGWRGHVVRALCEDIDPDTKLLADYCQPQPFDEPEESFGPCPQSREWDAGECLQLTDWKDRRLYMNDENNVMFEIADVNGKATAKFIAALNDPALGIAGGPFDQKAADAIAGFIKGKDWPDGWKLPGLATSAPIVVRRIPKPDEDFAPSVGIRDPHCAGRKLSGITEVADSLVDFAEEAWDPAAKINLPSEHYEYQEAVLIGDDLGILHAFQFDSGNELWGLLPRFLLDNAVAEYANGTDNLGQPDNLDEHVYGLGGTLNQGWAYDPGIKDWRHYAVIGAGNGGRDLMALDLSHMSPVSPNGPVEVLWTSQDLGLAPTYDKILGETWARPALSFHVPNDELGALPEAFLVFGSGYASNPATDPGQGRTLVLADAMTGKIVESALLPSPTTPLYETAFGAVVDPAVGTHCVSRYWGEMQEMYVNDPAGRLYRWDLARGLKHDGDSGQEWKGNAYPVATFRACQGKDDLSCTVQGANNAEPFAYGPAVVSNDRIDDESGFASGYFDDARRDQFLVAMISGSVFDDAIDGGKPDNDFHSSIYLLADDHTKAANHKGFSIPNGAPKTDVGTHDSFFRLALSDIERTRTFTPFPGSDTYEEKRVFSKAARPIRAPKIKVTGLVDTKGTPNPDDDIVVEDVEVYYIEYVVYEPGDRSCDQRWYDPKEEEWVFDEGSTYTIRLRLTVKDGDGYDFINGSGKDFTDGYGITGSGLSAGAVEQRLDGNCADGVCGPSAGTDDQTACDPNSTNPPASDAWAVGLSHQEVDGFSPLEIPVP